VEAMKKNIARMIVGIGLVIAVLIPIFSYIHFENIVISQNAKIANLNDQIDDLQAQNDHLRQENSQLVNITKPYLVTKLGWYIHKSNDSVISTRNTFTIYGAISNLGNAPALNPQLTIYFYDRNHTLLLKSKVDIPTVNPLTMDQLEKQHVACEVADQVTNVDIKLEY
jgi:hypothetical protein